MTQDHFPGIDFSYIETVKDKHFQRYEDSGERGKVVELRTLKFLKWLLAR